MAFEVMWLHFDIARAGLRKPRTWELLVKMRAAFLSIVHCGTIL